MAEPLVSIAVPTYNRVEELKKVLDCFCNQTYRNIEIIVSDNCSTDNTPEMMSEYIKSDSRIKYFRQIENIGMKRNGDFLFSNVSGELFFLASDDDWWDNNFVFELVNLLKENKDAVCAFSDFQEVDINGKKIDSYPFHYPLLKEFDDVNQVDRLKKFILQKENHGKANMHRSLCYRKLFIESVESLYKLGLAECWGFDQLLAFMLLVKGRLVVSDKLMFKCTVGNQKYYKDPRSKLKYLEGYEKIIDDCLKDNEAIQVKKALDTRFYDKQIGFYHEFLDLIKKLVNKSFWVSNDLSLKYLKEILNLIILGQNTKVVNLIKEFSSKLNMPFPSVYISRLRNLFFWGKKKQQIKIAKEIIKRVEKYEENR